MAFTVPNRPDAGIAADQAEPDSGDFQTLGYQKTGVLSGGAVTKLAANTVRVGAITGYLNGEYFEVDETDRGSFSVPPTGSSKFVLILVQKNASGEFIVYDHQGTAGNNGQSATNARYPDDVDYTTKMLLATVYYADGDGAIGTNAIVDKRVFILPQANPSVIAAAPASTTAGAIGEIKIDSSVTPGNGTSNVWVKTAASTWTNLGTAVTVSDGNPGTPATIAVTGAVTGDAGTNVVVENVGTATAAILKFTIPKGDTGGGGGQGIKGDDGEKGDKGDDGSPASGDLFKVAESVFSTPHTMSTGETLVLYGGNDITVTRSTSAFTINWDGAGTYLPLSAGTSKPLTGNLLTQAVYPTNHGVHNVGLDSRSYATGYFQTLRLSNHLHCNTVYCITVNEASDLSLKEDFAESPGLEFVTSLKPLSYRLKAAPDKRHWGFGAQDVAAVCDDTAGIVHKDEHLGLSYREFTAPIVKAIQELTERLEAIENG